MSIAIPGAFRAPFGELLPLLAFGVAVVGLFGTVQVAGELRYILECAGAVGGPRPGRT